MNVRKEISFSPEPAFMGNPRARIALVLLVFLGAFAFFASNLTGRVVGGTEGWDQYWVHEIFRDGKLGLPEDQSPVFYIFQNLWLRIDKDHLFFTRLPSAVFGALAVLCIFLFLETEAGTLSGLLAALFMTVNPFLALYFRVARLYALETAIATASLLFMQRYLRQGRKTGDLAAFLALSILGIYTYLPYLLFIACLGTFFLMDLIVNRRRILLLLLGGMLGAGAIYPQLRRVFKVVDFPQKAAIDHLSHEPLAFFLGIGKQFFLGIGKMPGYANYLLIAVALLVLIGIIALRWRGVAAALLLVAPILGVTWHVSAKSVIAPRYFIFLLPVLICLIAGGVGKLKRIYLVVPLAVLIAVQSLALVGSEFPKPPSDWDKLGQFVEQERKPGDVVAVFPNHWVETFRLFYHHDDMVPFMNPEEVERMLAGGKRVFVFQGSGRYAGHVKDYFKRHVKIIKTFRNKYHQVLSISVLDRRKSITYKPKKSNDPSICITGIVGSGGYPWQVGSEKENPFKRLSPVFSGADICITGFEAYKSHPIGRLQKFFHPDPVSPREPNTLVARYMAQAGIGVVALQPRSKGVPNPVPILQEAAIKTLPIQKKWSGSEPDILNIKGINVGVLQVGQKVKNEALLIGGQGTASVAELDQALAHAKDAVGPDGRLVVFLPQAADYELTFNRADQWLARRAIDLGADAVVGMGGWAAKELEEYRGGIIAYSLGTLIRPPHQKDVAINSNGLALRLSFPKGQPVQYEVIPVTFDDLFRPALARREVLNNLYYRTSEDPAAEHLSSKLNQARAAIQLSTGQTADLTSWWAPPGSGHVGYSQFKNKIEVAEAMTLGIMRRSIILNPREVRKIWVTFKTVSLGEKLQIVYCSSNRSGYRREKPPVQLKVTIGESERLTKQVHNFAGWETVDIDTGDLAGRAADISIALESAKNDFFPIAVDPIVIRSPETVALLKKHSP